MRYRFFGKTDMKFSLVGFGAWQAGMKSWGRNYSRQDIINAMNTAFSLGVNFIDTAEIYGYGESEKVVGEVLKNWKNIFVSTKISGYNATPKKILRTLKKSLERLNKKYVDLYQIHWPPSYYTSICKVFRELEKISEQGLIRYIGVSNFSRIDLEKSIYCLRKYKIVSNQIQYNLLYRRGEEELIPYMKNNGIELLAWSPLAKGALAGKTRVNAIAKMMDMTFLRARRKPLLLNKIKEIAERHDVSMARVSIAWLISKKAYPIPGAKNPSQARDNALAGDLILNSSEIKLLDDFSKEFTTGKIGSIIPRFVPNIIQEFAVRMIGGI